MANTVTCQTLGEMSTPSRAGSSMQHATRLTQPRRMLQRSKDKTARRVVQTSGTSGSAYRKKWVNSAIFKKYLQCVLAPRIMIVDFVVCTLAVKKIRVGFDMSDRNHSLVKSFLLRLLLFKINTLFFAYSPSLLTWQCFCYVFSTCVFLISDGILSIS
jgi:hypothetical protein